MTGSAAASRLTDAAETLRTAHARMLGSLQLELTEAVETRSERVAQVEVKARRTLLIGHTRASNTVTAAHAAVRDRAREAAPATPTTPPSPQGVAEVAHFGDLTINAKRAGVNDELVVPLLLPLFSQTPISVIGASESTDALIRGIHLQAVTLSAPGDLSLAAYDPLLAGPLASFAALNALGDDHLTTARTPRELDALLDELTDHVSGERGSRSPSGPRARIVSLHSYPTGVSEAQHRRLVNLARVAGQHRLGFIYQLTGLQDAPPWFDAATLIADATAVDVSPTRMTWRSHPHLNATPATATADDVVQSIEPLIAQAERASRVEISDLISPEPPTASSANGIVARIARDGIESIDVTFGDEVPHGIITGSSGSGKSNLLKLVIHTIASRYSPDEVEMYLLDMKEGVTLAPLAPTRDDPTCLPHARVIGMQADQEFGLSVLRDIERLYKRRMATMSPYDNIKDYRRDHPSERLPRVVLIIDEFQLLLADDPNRIGKAAADKLVALTKLVRAAGIHIILATQEIGFSALSGIRESLLAQLKLRIGLQNTPRGAEQTFEIGNQAAATLRVKGQVVVNTELGAIDGNRIGRTPLAEDAHLRDLREQWYRTRPDGHPAPIVFDGRQAASIADDAVHVRARGSSAVRRVPLGRPVAARMDPVTFSLDPVPGRNLAVVGGCGLDDDDLVDSAAPTHPALGVLTACGSALAAVEPPGSVDIVVIDMLAAHDRERGGIPDWLAHLTAAGHTPRIVTPSDAMAWIAETAATLPTRSDSSRPMYVFGLGFERVGPISEREGGPGSVAPVKHLQRMLEHGPTVGVHSFFWWAQGQTFLAHVERRTDVFFAGTVILAGADEAAQRVHDLSTKWSGEDNRGLYRDAGAAQAGQKIIPYRPMTPAEAEHFREAVAG